jgi:exonuclease III
LHVISAYAPTDPADTGKTDKPLSKEKEKDQFYAKLQAILAKIPKRDIVTLGGDFNAQIGEDHTLWKGTLGQHGLAGENKSDNGARLLSFCTLNNLFLANTSFRHRKGSKWTWPIKDKKHQASQKHIIDYICVNARYRDAVCDTKAWSAFAL